MRSKSWLKFDLYKGMPLWVENCEVVKLRNTNCYKSMSQS